MTEEEQKEVLSIMNEMVKKQTDDIKKMGESVQKIERVQEDIVKSQSDTNKKIQNNHDEMKTLEKKIEKRLLKFPHITVTVALGICFLIAFICLCCFDKEKAIYYTILAAMCLIGLIVVNCYYILCNSNNRDD